MHLTITTPEKTVFNEEVEKILVPTEKGQIGVLPHHINLVSQLTSGEMIITAKGKEKVLAITGGFLDVQHDNVTILADYAEHAEEIDLEKARTAQKRAEEVLSKKTHDVTDPDIIRAEGELRRALLQQHIAQRRHRKQT